MSPKLISKEIKAALAVAALMLAAAAALPILRRAGVLSGDSAELRARGVNVLLGLLVVWMANAGAKRLPPLGRTGCDPAREQAARRFASLTLVLGALAYTAAWLFAPYALAFTLSIAALGGAMAIATARCLTLRWERA